MTDPVSRLNAALEGRYRVERQVGEGGMATVYLADDLKHDRRVALKVLEPDLAAAVGAGRFLAEIKTTAKLQHPHILPLFDSGEADRLLFYVMPFVEGESLRDRLDRERQLPVDEAVAIASKVAGALQAAHDRLGSDAFVFVGIGPTGGDDLLRVDLETGDTSVVVAWPGDEFSRSVSPDQSWAPSQATGPLSGRSTSST